ncbi:ElyC/SanA/YdcF family protein [Photobacterium lutimaris]|uniref:DUF218 domain-containing protein n=1 Tax=Photobacterium lutimaris TaxID=388278 RepID=A0A2T3J2Q5_9GAMM|nr:ElyC/SanA/YdcF family protein [Photobacterium lutimaris]PSU35546.1 hypothetical protein C9I99_00560 [Photobacterium lutimaris]TDR78597.1 DUF218 domain-containing protein [Photobacterium lutimaris]
MKKSVIAKSILGALLIGATAHAVASDILANEQNLPIDLVFNLGLQVNYKYCTPRQLMEYRVDRVYEVAQSLPNPVFMATGKGNPTLVQTGVEQGGLTEAAAIQQILMEKYDVPEDQIILEENSTTTTSTVATLTVVTVRQSVTLTPSLVMTPLSMTTAIPQALSP